MFAHMYVMYAHTCWCAWLTRLRALKVLWTSLSTALRPLMGLQHWIFPWAKNHAILRILKLGNASNSDHQLKRRYPSLCLKKNDLHNQGSRTYNVSSFVSALKVLPVMLSRDGHPVMTLTKASVREFWWPSKSTQLKGINVLLLLQVHLVGRLASRIGMRYLQVGEIWDIAEHGRIHCGDLKVGCSAAESEHTCQFAFLCTPHVWAWKKTKNNTRRH